MTIRPASSLLLAAPLCLMIGAAPALAADAADAGAAPVPAAEATAPDSAAKAAPAAEEPKRMTKEEFLAALKPQTGTISLPGGVATVKLGDKYRYLSPESTEALLVNGWGNPPGSKTLGMIIPADTNPVDEKGWGVVIDYTDDGYVSDKDAETINYDDLLKDMKEQVEEDSKERVKQGYPAMHLVGWGEKPTYDKATHKMYWAKEFSTAGVATNSLNYDIRVLGRKGVLVLSAVAGMDQLDMIKKETPALLAMTEFTEENRYEKFDSKTDKVAEYGLAALVAGGIAAKMGLFAKLLAVVIAAKKLVVVAVVGAGAYLKKLFKRDKAV